MTYGSRFRPVELFFYVGLIEVIYVEIKPLEKGLLISLEVVVDEKSQTLGSDTVKTTIPVG